MKKFFSLSFVFAAFLFLAACGGGNGNGGENGGENGGAAEGGDTPILVVSREEGSGTRDAFQDLVDVNTDEDNAMRDDVVIRDGNGVVATEVMGNEAAIGYVTFATLHEHEDQLQGLLVNGVEPTKENVLNGTYELSRDFVMVFPEEGLSELGEAFVAFIQSEAGKEALAAEDGIVDMANAQPFNQADFQGVTGTLALGGSTSTEDAVMSVVEEFEAMFPGTDLRYDSVGSSAGISGGQDGTFDIGFASRALEEGELQDGFEGITICREGIAIIAHRGNSVTGLTLDQLRDIYLGNINDWSEIQ